MGDEFSALAEKMGGGSPHAAALRTLSEQVQIEINNASFNPSNREVRNAIRKLRAECDRFTVALNGLGGWKFLYLPSDKLEVLPKVHNDIEGVKALCDQALGLNPPRHAIPKPGMVTCALVVCEVWASLNGRTPGHNNDEAQEACEEYWQACGQSRGKSVGRWEYHLREARRKRRSKRYLWISQEVARITEGK